MTIYKTVSKDIAVGDEVEIPDDAEHIEIEWYTQEYEREGIGIETVVEERVRVQYLIPC